MNTNQHFYSCLLCRIPTTDPVMICPECRRRAKLWEKMEKETSDLESHKSTVPVVPAPDTDHCPVCGGDLRWAEAGGHLNVECSAPRCSWWSAESLKRMGTESIPMLLVRVRKGEIEKCERKKIPESGRLMSPVAVAAGSPKTQVSSTRDSASEIPRSAPQTDEGQGGPTLTSKDASAGISQQDGPTRLFLVIAHRGGDRENHSYPVGVGSSLEKAKAIKKAAEQYRGGKYDCSVWVFDLNQDDLAVKTDEELIEPQPLEGWKTHAQKMIDESRLHELCKRRGRLRRLIEAEEKAERRKKLLRRVLDWANGGMKNWAEIMPDIEKELDP